MTATSRQFQYQAPFPEFRARQRKKKISFPKFFTFKKQTRDFLGNDIGLFTSVVPVLA
jgi:hypothetical protein